MNHQLYRHKLVAKSAAALVMAGAFASMGLITEASAASTFTVNSTVDSVDSNPGNGICADASGNCTLKAAIMEANALAGADTINLAPGAIYTLDIPMVPAYEVGLFVGSQITINGNGATIRRSSASGTPLFNLFHVAYGDLTLTAVTLSGGVSLPEASAITSLYLGGNSFIMTPPFSPSAIWVTSGGIDLPASMARGKPRAW